MDSSTATIFEILTRFAGVFSEFVFGTSMVIVVILGILKFFLLLWKKS